MPDYVRIGVIDKSTNKSRLLNARTERIVADPKSVWYRHRDQRVLVPTSGFFENRHIPGWKKTVPYFIRVANQEIFFLPGLYTKSKIPDEEGNFPETFAISIRDANPIMMQIHNGGDNPFRMPLVIPPAQALSWLDPGLKDEEMTDIFQYEIPSSALEYWSVKSLYRGDRFDQSLLERFEYEGEPPFEVIA